MTNIFTAVIHKEDALYVATCTETGNTSQGESVEDAMKNLRVATELYLAEFPLGSTSYPRATTFEVTNNA